MGTKKVILSLRCLKSIAFGTPQLAKCTSEVKVFLACAIVCQQMGGIADFHNVLFSNNSANIDGGAVQVGSESTLGGMAQFDTVMFRNNSAQVAHSFILSHTALFHFQPTALLSQFLLQTAASLQPAVTP